MQIGSKTKSKQRQVARNEKTFLNDFLPTFLQILAKTALANKIELICPSTPLTNYTQLCACQL